MIVSLEQIKQHLRIQHDDEDELLMGLLLQVQGAAEDFCKTLFDESAPHPVRLAIVLMASHFYEYRDASDRFALQAMRRAFESLLWPHRDVSKLL